MIARRETHKNLANLTTMANNKTLCIVEWQVFGVDDIEKVIADKSEVKATKIFKELKNFADEKDNHIFLNSYGKNRLRARNYVGLIQTKSGFCLEILPKTFRTANENDGFKIKDCICSSFDKNNETRQSDKVDSYIDKSAHNDNLKSQKCQVCKAKDLLLKMLKTLKNSPFKQSHISNLKTQNAHLLEIFVIMFLNELEMLIKKGLKSDYIECEQNRKFLKGKLLFTQNLKHNFAHKERFFTASDEFSSDIAPNKLIKSTLLLLSTRHFSTKTNARIMQSRFVFDEINPSQNYDKDFAKCVSLRHFKAYELLLLWCKIFLKKQTFTAYQGSQNAFALLFDMNKLFESFVAWHLKRYVAHKQCEYEIKAQNKSKHLLKCDNKDKFLLIPDIVGFKGEKALFIADTKWKILSVDEAKNFSISQSDLYQIFAYLSKYACRKGYLIYPKIQNCDYKGGYKFVYKAKICFFDKKQSENLSSIKDIKELLDEVNKVYKKQDITLRICFFDVNEPKKAAISFSSKTLILSSN